ncbi:MAG: tyrosine-type recombinase/integrase [Clostridia bacterium]|nr:tyrosine-type recombinase/integrase [Clostridia bacterium]
MKNCQEELFQNVRNSLIASGFSPVSIDRIINIFIINLNEYDITEKCTAIEVRETTSEKILKLYAGILLTEGKTQKTVYGYVRLISRFLYEMNKPLLEVNVFDIRVWLAKMQQQVSLRTCENYRSYLSAFYQWLTREELISTNPTAKIKPIKYDDVVRLPFSEIELDALRSACATLRERAEFELFISSGVRVSELCAMNITDINLNSLDVLVREGKGNKQRTTYINTVCAVHLKRYLESRTDDAQYLFITRNHTRLTKSAAESDLKRIGQRANVPITHPHRCRRTFASDLARKGMDVRTIQQLMGHSNINTTMGYITLSNEHIKNEYRRFA